MTHFLSDLGSKLKFVHAESSTLSVPVYEICAEVINLQELESCLQFCSDQQAGLVLWKTHPEKSRVLRQYVGRKCTYTQEVSIYTIHLNLSLITCLQSRGSSMQIKCRQVDKLESNQFRIDPCSLSKTFSDPNFTSAEVRELFLRKVDECNVDQSQYFILPESEQNFVGFVAVKTENATARSTLIYVSDDSTSEDFVGLICSVLTSLLSRGIATCTFEIQSSNTHLKNLIIQCGGVFVETMIHHNFWFSTEEVRNDQVKSEIPQNIPFLTGNELGNVKKILDSSSISTHNKYGPYCERYLEKSLGCLKALLVSSGTSALELCSLALNLGVGDEVIMPSYTFVSTANAFVVYGATPVFIDVRKDTLNIDESLIENAITPKTKAIVVVHYAGVSCEMDVIMKIAKKYNLYVIEDNAHGVYAKYKGKYLGTIGHLSALSFHYTKNITCGEGGAVMINDYKLIGACLIAWEKGTNRYDFMSGKVNKYSWVGKGSSFILSEINASLLAAQVGKFS